MSIIHKTSQIEMRFNDQGSLHREDGPAIIYADGTSVYYKYGKLHRLDGPAVDFLDGRQEYWIDGRSYSRDAWMIKSVLES